MKRLLFGLSAFSLVALIGYGQSEPVKEPIRYRFDRAQRDTVIYAQDIYDANAQQKPPTYRYKLIAIWRYDAESKRWQKTALVDKNVGLLFAESRRKYLFGKDLLKQKVPIGLYYLIASVNGNTELSFVYHGMLCEDLKIGIPPRGMIACCVPLTEDSAQATFVPDPKVLSAEQK